MTVFLVIAAVLAALGLAWWIRSQRRAFAEAPLVIPEAQQHVVVLAHGILGFEHLKVLGTRQHYFRGVATFLAGHGAAIHAPRLHPLGSVPQRAAALAAYIKDLDERRIIVIAHSMGGLDARHAVAEESIASMVNALITVATPHRGTCLADAANILPARAARSVLGRVGLKTDALDWLGEGSAERFNQRISDARDVYYGSVVANTSRTQLLANPLLLACYEILLKMRGDNDGLVPVASQQWGEKLMTVRAHHWAQIGWSPRFDASGLYLSVLRRLHGQGLHCLPAAAVPKELCAAGDDEAEG